jgi:hypothetical protein
MSSFALFDTRKIVMPGLGPGIHVPRSRRLLVETRPWMAGTSPAMTIRMAAKERLRRHRAHKVALADLDAE